MLCCCYVLYFLCPLPCACACVSVLFVVVLPCLSSVSALRDTKYDLSFIVNADGNNAFADDELPATVQYKLAAFGNKTHIRYI